MAGPLPPSPLLIARPFFFVRLHLNRNILRDPYYKHHSRNVACIREAAKKVIIHIFLGGRKGHDIMEKNNFFSLIFPKAANLEGEGG